MGCPGCDGRSDRHLEACQNQRISLGLPASSRTLDTRVDEDMGVMKDEQLSGTAQSSGGHEPSPLPEPPPGTNESEAAVRAGF